MSAAAARWEGQSAADLQQRWDRPHVHIYGRVDSTNTRARELAEAGAAAGTLIVADEQTAGRGLESRRWHSPRGSGLYLTLVLRPSRLVNPTLIPLIAGMAVARSIERSMADMHVGIKWPNDLIVRDRKAGGVLCESTWAGKEPNYLVIGVGINVSQGADEFPSELRDIATSLWLAGGGGPSRLELADLVIDELEERCAAPPDTLDRESLKEFDERDWLRDRRCSIERDGTPPVRATVVGIAPDGALLFRPDRGALERITAGHVLVEDLPTPDY